MKGASKESEGDAESSRKGNRYKGRHQMKADWVGLTGRHGYQWQAERRKYVGKAQ
jgi:hypothetical protein